MALLEETPKYQIELLDGSTLLFRWGDVDELSVSEYMEAIRRLAARCDEHGSRAIVVDVRGRRVDVRFDDAWWRREILPVYRRVGVERFAHVTGEPDAPGEWAGVPDGVTFGMASFAALDDALRWVAGGHNHDDEENEMNEQRPLEETEQYRIVAIDGDTPTLLLDWKRVDGQLSVVDDRGAVKRFAELCGDHQPLRAVIDVHRLEDQEERAGHDGEAFEPWWLREIVPAYQRAGVAGLAIVIGDPNAPGETDDLPPGVEFKRGYFGDLEAALRWRPS